jgi:hypothetical protein
MAAHAQKRAARKADKAVRTVSDLAEQFGADLADQSSSALQIQGLSPGLQSHGSDVTAL